MHVFICCVIAACSIVLDVNSQKYSFGSYITIILDNESNVIVNASEYAKRITATNVVWLQMVMSYLLPEGTASLVHPCIHSWPRQRLELMECIYCEVVVQSATDNVQCVRYKSFYSRMCKRTCVSQFCLFIEQMITSSELFEYCMG